MARRGCAMYYRKVVTIAGNTLQQWSGFPESPYPARAYVYQFIAYLGGNNYLLLSMYPFYTEGGYIIDGNGQFALYVGTFSWTNGGTVATFSDTCTLLESNHDIYTDSTLTDVYFAKTTTPEQDVGSQTTKSNIRI